MYLIINILCIVFYREYFIFNDISLFFFLFMQMDEFLRIFEVLVGRVGIELQYICFIFSGKEYRYDQLEVCKWVEDIGIKDWFILFMVF